MATASIIEIGQVALQALKLCNKCCKYEEQEDDDKNKEDDQKENDDEEEEDVDDVSDNDKDEKESESKVDEKKECAPLNKKKRRAKKKRRHASSDIVEPVTTQPFTIQTTINPVFYNNFQPHPSTIPPGIPEWVLPNGTDSATTDQSVVKWEDCSVETAVKFKDTVIVGGYDIDETDLWIIRGRFKGEVIPGKLNQFHKLAFIAYKTEEGYYAERNIDNFEVLCIASESRSRICWTKCSDGVVPKNAVEAGRKASEEKLYIGRARHEDERNPRTHSLCPGMVQPSHGVLYVTYGLKVHAHKFYEVLCID